MTNRRVSVEVDANVGPFSRKMAEASAAAKGFAKELESSDRHVSNLTAGLVGMGPALIPLTAAALPAVTGLAAGLGVAAAAAGTAVLAFHGLGDAMTALDDYQLEPTKENLAAMREEFDKIGPAGEQFVRYLDGLEPQLESLQTAAREGMFPGVEEGLNSLLGLLPEARRMIFDLSTEMGHLAAEAGKSLSGDDFEAFFRYLQTDAAPTLDQFAHTLGNVAQGFAHLMVDFAPLTRDFTSGLEHMSQEFADWAAHVGDTQGFQDFVSYVQRTGPQALDLLGALAEAFAGIIHAAAPVGDAVLPTLTALVKILGAIANSPIGPPLYTGVAALMAVDRAAALATKSMGALGVTAGTTSAKLTAMGTAGTALALGLGSISDSMEIVDSLHRSGDAADATAKSYLQLATALQNSNVGKYAADLGINVQMLAKDLIDNGKSGEYAGQVLDMLAGKSHGFGAMLQAQAGAVLPFYTAASDKAYDANKDLGAIIGNNTKLLGAGMDATNGAGETTGKYADYTAVAGKTAERTGSQVRGLVSAMEEQRQAALSGFDAQTQWGEAVKAASAAAAKGKRGINAMSDAGRENRQALSGLASAWNNQSKAVRNNTERFHEAKQQFIDTATAMGVPIDRARELAKRLLDIPKNTVIRIDAHDTATARIQGLKSELATIDRDIYINIHARTPSLSGFGPQIGSADGSTVPGPRYPYGDRVPYLLAPGEEVTSNRHGQADSFRPELKDINAGLTRQQVFNRMVARGLADGGTAGFGTVGGMAGGGTAGGHLSIDDRMAILQALQQIRDLQKELAHRNKKGQLTLTGLDRRIAEVQLEAARRDLHAARTREERELKQKQREEQQAARQKARETRQNVRGILQGFSLDGIIPDNTPVTIASQTHDALAELKKQILDAGGEWTKAMTRWAKGLVAQASHLDDINSQLDAETKHRDELMQTLQDQQQALEQLQSTMDAFSAQVASNFTVNDLPGRTTTTVPGSVDPTLAGNLSAAQARLAELRNSPQGDSVAAAAEANRLMQQIAAMQAEVAAQQQPVEQTTDAYQSLREQLISNTADAEAFASALQQLSAEGLNADLFAQIASTGDLQTALDLLAGGQAAVDDINALWEQNAVAAAQLASYTTQEVYGDQQAALMAQIDAQNQLIAQATFVISVLTAEQQMVGDQIRAGAAQGTGDAVGRLHPDLVDIRRAINNLPRITAEHKKKAKV